MNTSQTIELPTIESGLAVFNERETGLRQLASDFKGLKVNGVNDREGFTKLSKARITLKNERISIEKDGKALREGALKFQKSVIARENELIEIIRPVEMELKVEEQRIEYEKEAIRIEQERKEKQRVQDRINALDKFGYSIDLYEAHIMPDDKFNELLTHAETEWKAEQERIAFSLAIEEQKRKEEQERERLEREEFERQKAEYKELAVKAKKEREYIEEQQRIKEAEIKASREKLERDHAEREEHMRKQQEEKEQWLKAERDKMTAERESIAEEKRKHEQAIAYEKELKLTQENVRIEAEAKAKRIEDERIAKERQAIIDAERQEALKPDKERLLSYANHLSILPVPVLSDPECIEVLGYVIEKLKEVESYIKDQVSKL